MSLSRRRLLQVGLAGGAIAAAGLPLSAARAAILGSPVRLLVGSQAPASFVGGVRAGLGSAGLTADLGSDAADSLDWLRRAPGRRLIGLVDSADAVLVRELARDGRIRWLASAHHSQRVDDHRHAVDNLPASRGLGEVLANAEGDWAPLLGLSLGRIAAGRWQSSEMPRPLAQAGRGGHLSVASFVIAS